jgi:UDP-galactopyranose mutase
MENNQLARMSTLVTTDLICFSHLRWDFVYQRPQHLMSRFARRFRTYFIEEALYHQAADTMQVRLAAEGVWVITPFLNEESTADSVITRQRNLINQLFIEQQIENYSFWYYTPMALKISSHLKPKLIIYDCMDELSAFKFAPAELKIMEAELFSKAAVVFTGGHSLYRAKKNAHHNIHPFPSSIDKAHFLSGRANLPEPEDQLGIPRLRFGFYGVIDERFNIKLIKEVAERRPEWHLILIGPVVKINPDDLPKLNNIHYLGCKSYNELPVYLSGWDFAMIPFEKNESTEFISPTKTPEYLAAGKPVISTSITDVISPYADKNLVYIADNADEFIASVDNELAKDPGEVKKWLREVDMFLVDISWDHTTALMMSKIDDCLMESAVTEETTGLKHVA